MKFPVWSRPPARLIFRWAHFHDIVQKIWRQKRHEQRNSSSLSLNLGGIPCIFYILSGDYWNTAPSGDSWSSKCMRPSTAFWQNQIFYNSCCSVEMSKVVVSPEFVRNSAEHQFHQPEPPFSLETLEMMLLWRLNEKLSRESRHFIWESEERMGRVLEFFELCLRTINFS